MNRKEFLLATGATLSSLAILPKVIAETASGSEAGKKTGAGSWQSSQHKFRLEKDGELAVDDKGGSIRLMNSKMFPALRGMTMYSVHLKKGGLREPHWHPNATELNYVISGKVRIGILHADGTRETFDLEPGDTGFIPQGWFHYIENIHDGDTNIIVSFGSDQPEDVGISNAVGFLSNKMLGTSFGVSEKVFEPLPKPEKAYLVVPR